VFTLVLAVYCARQIDDVNRKRLNENVGGYHCVAGPMARGFVESLTREDLDEWSITAASPIMTIWSLRNDRYGQCQGKTDVSHSFVLSIELSSRFHGRLALDKNFLCMVFIQGDPVLSNISCVPSSRDSYLFFEVVVERSRSSTSLYRRTSFNHEDLLFLGSMIDNLHVYRYCLICGSWAETEQILVSKDGGVSYTV
jgi:hypothetical protein